MIYEIIGRSLHAKSSLFAMERCTSTKTRDTPRLLRDERIQRVERTGCVYYFIHFMPLFSGATAADDGLCFIGEYPLSHFLILNAQDAARSIAETISV